jgi:hypothetical protein
LYAKLKHGAKKENFTPRLEPGDYGHNNRVKQASAVKELKDIKMKTGQKNQKKLSY